MSRQLPKTYEEFRKDFPELVEAYDALGKAAHECGPLDQRRRELVKLGLAIGARQEGSIRSHTRRAVEAGVSREDLLQVIGLAVTTVGFGPTVATYAWVKDELAQR